MRAVRLVIVLVAVVAVSIAFLPQGVEWFYKRFAATPENSFLTKLVSDPAKNLEQLEITKHFANKRVVVVGGTKGIGKGIAIALAKVGSHVTILGRRGGDEVAKQMSSDAPNRNFKFISADLSTTTGCRNAVAEIVDVAQGNKLDALVMTLGVWPDWKHPLTPEGYSKTVFIDVVARYMMFKGLLNANLLRKNAQVNTRG